MSFGATPSELLDMILHMALLGLTLSLPAGLLAAYLRAPGSRRARPTRRRPARPRVAADPGTPRHSAGQPTPAYTASLRRAAPVIRLLGAARLAGEKEAAYQALCRLARAAGTRGTERATPAALYRDATSALAPQIAGRDPPPFDRQVYAELMVRC